MDTRQIFLECDTSDKNTTPPQSHSVRVFDKNEHATPLGRLVTVYFDSEQTMFSCKRISRLEALHAQISSFANGTLSVATHDL